MSQNFPSPGFPQAPQENPGIPYSQSSAFDHDSVPLDQPLYGASFKQALSRFFKKIFVFQGRASRSEYWWSILFFAMIFVGVFLITMLTLLVLSSLNNSEVLGGVFMVMWAILMLTGLFGAVAYLGIRVRRLHDANFSGWLLLLALIPGGDIAVFVMLCMPNTPEGARFDPPWTQSPQTHYGR